MKQFPKTRPGRKWLPLDVWKSRKIAQAEADMERITFMEKLDAGELLLTEWEEEFVGSFMQARSEGREQNWWTDGRRMAADKMRDKYGPELDLSRRSKVESRGSVIPDADPGGCMYLVHEDGGQQRPCNEPAKWVTKAGFRYCETHRQIAAEACNRKKAGFSVRLFNESSSDAL